MRKYNPGDEAWYAHYDLTSVTKPCPVCYGIKQVTLILGNSDKVALPCDYCGHGYHEPTGQITEYEYISKAKHIIISKVQSEADAIGEERKYYFGAAYADIKDLFDTEAEALARCAEKAEHQKHEDNTQAHRLKANHLKSYAWNAGYHLRQAQDLRKRAEYHDHKAILCKERAK